MVTSRDSVNSHDGLCLSYDVPWCAESRVLSGEYERSTTTSAVIRNSLNNVYTMQS